jgi:hypothetical protein
MTELFLRKIIVELHIGFKTWPKMSEIRQIRLYRKGQLLKRTFSWRKNCHTTVKSEAIACARRCRSSWLTGWWTRKRRIKKMEEQGGEEAQGVADPKIG